MNFGTSPGQCGLTRRGNGDGGLPEGSGAHCTGNVKNGLREILARYLRSYTTSPSRHLVSPPVLSILEYRLPVIP
jgi:hypothetical protein